MNNSLIQYVKELDASRFAVHVSQGCWWADPERAAILFTHDDVICVNSPYGVFTRDRKPKECAEKISEYWGKL